MKPILQTNAGSFGHAAGEHLWNHAERCAHACAWLGKTTGCDAFEAYLAGIIRHTGTGAVVRLLAPLTPPDAAPPSSGFLAGCAGLAATPSLQSALHRSEEHTSYLQSLMRLSSPVFCLTTNIYTHTTNTPTL